MKRLPFWFFCCVGLLLAIAPITLHSPGWASSVPMMMAQAEVSEVELRPFAEVIRNTKKQGGLFNLYQQSETGQVYLEINPQQFNRNLLLVTTLESGLGEERAYSGFPLKNYLVQFRRVNNIVQLVAPNNNFRTDPDDPQRQSVRRSFSESILAAFPIASIHPQSRNILVEITPLLLGTDDVAGLTVELPWLFQEAYIPNPNPGTSYVRQLKAFPQNVEFEAVQSFVLGQGASDGLTSLPDARNFSLSLRYSLSQLPEQNGYKSRHADERVGYFVTAFQNLTQQGLRTPFVRYIERWQLEPQNPDAPQSSPKQPIVFWIENTTPPQFRDAIREGALMWNEAFKKIGIQGAIEVRQMPDNAEWDPADVRYNTIRWSNTLSSSTLGIGPIRVNPLTGQILDADIILDGNVVRFVRGTSDLLVREQQTSAIDLLSTPQFCSPSLRNAYVKWLQGQTSDRPNERQTRAIAPTHAAGEHELCFGYGANRQLSFGAIAMSVQQNLLPNSDEMDVYVNQFLRWLTAHEVGHALGLRHNFRGSTMLSPEQMHNKSITQTQGLSGSVMDYLSINLSPENSPQGDYFPVVLGPYDYWAIEYGYKATQSNPREETRTLEAIARRNNEPGLGFATDEDVFASHDPTANVWDMSNNTLSYSRTQIDNTRSLLDKLTRRYPLSGESYSELRDRFDIVLDHYFEQCMILTRYVGGQVFNRERQGTPGGRLPFELVPATRQREALDAISRYVFAEGAFPVPPDLINRLAPSRWMHWGSWPLMGRLDYPIYDTMLEIQTLVLQDLLNSDRLSQIRDSELRGKPGEILTLTELMNSLHSSIWKEVQQPGENPSISSLRRGLQRKHLNMLTNMTLRNTNIQRGMSFSEFLQMLQTLNAPDDARVLSRFHLRKLHEEIRTALRRNGDEMDTLTVAHLEDIRDRIEKVLNAQMQSM